MDPPWRLHRAARADRSGTAHHSDRDRDRPTGPVAALARRDAGQFHRAGDAVPAATDAAVRAGAPRHGHNSVRAPGASLPYYGQGASFNRGGWGYGLGYSYGYGGYGSGYGGYDDGDYDFGPPHLPARSAPNFVLANVFPATLTVELPAGAKPAEYVLTSPELKAGDPYTFAVNVRWASGGKTYEAKRSVTLNAGDRSRLHILSGDEVKE